MFSERPSTSGVNSLADAISSLYNCIFYRVLPEIKSFLCLQTLVITEEDIKMNVLIYSLGCVGKTHRKSSTTTLVENSTALPPSLVEDSAVLLSGERIRDMRTDRNKYMYNYDFDYYAITVSSFATATGNLSLSGH
jgi:hypothetical protein